MHKPWHLPRRTFLKGVGASFMLPMLNAMVPRDALAQTMMKPRFAALFMPMSIYGQGYDPARGGRERFFRAEPNDRNGGGQGAWMPRDAGPLPATLPVILQPLAAWRGRLAVISGLAGIPNNLENNQHSLATTAWLTAGYDDTAEAQQPLTGESTRRSSAPPDSVDQRLANELGLVTGSTVVFNPTSAGGATGGAESNGGYMGAISYNTRLGGNHIVPQSKRPVDVYNRLFGTCVPQGSQPIPPTTAEQNNTRILDRVRDSITDVKRKLGREDLQRLDGYLTYINELERSVGAVERRSDASWCPEGMPQVDEQPAGQDWFDTVSTMVDVIALALATEAMPIATLMQNTEYHEALLYAPFVASHGGFVGYSGNAVRFPGATTNVHVDVAHKARGAGNADSCEQYIAYNRMQTKFFGRLMEKLDALPEDANGKTPLENSLLLLGACHGDGNQHRVQNLPTLLAGGSRYGLQQGKHIALTSGTATVDIGHFHYTVLKRLLGDVGKNIGDFNGHANELDGIFA